MDAVIAKAARALAEGDTLGALNHVALREEAPALALRGIAMARLGDYPKANALLRAAARKFGAGNPVARARCVVAQAEIALVCRDLGFPDALAAARAMLEDRGDRLNAVHAGHLESRRLLLIGRLDEAEQVLDELDPAPFPPAWQAAHALVRAGIALRRLSTHEARRAIARARKAAGEAGIPALVGEVESAARALEQPAARLLTRGTQRVLRLRDVEALLASDILIVDACRHVVRRRDTVVALTTRPVLFALARTLAEAWPADASREHLLAQAFGARFSDESHRARLRVEIARLRAALKPLATIRATREGFVLLPTATAKLAVLAPPSQERHGALLALLADGVAWSTSALALALGTSQRSVQRALDALAGDGKVAALGRGRARRWTSPPVAGNTTILLLPGPLPGS